MKKLILTLILGGTLAAAAAPSAKAEVVVVVHRHHRHHYHPGPAMRLVPGYWHGPFWRRVWVPAHYVRA